MSIWDSRDIDEQRRQLVFEESKRYGEQVFDTNINLCITRPGNTLHMTRESLLYAMALLEGEDEGEISWGCKIIDTVLSTQELDEGSRFYGSFKWNWEDPEPDSPTGNTAKFVCPSLIHMAVFHSHKLGKERAGRIRRSLSAASKDALVQGFNVSYTNIALLSCLSLIAGGEWLLRDDIVVKGRRILDGLISNTNEQGAPTEFNSPTYSFVSILALAWLRKLTRIDEIRLKTRVLENRIWLQLAGHYHPPICLLGGTVLPRISKRRNRRM